nr:dTDP-4-dehydrorhamnose 3,5-epimerase [Clostridia bacterium]
MPQARFEKGGLPGLILFTPFFAQDERGYFVKSFERGLFEEAGIPFALDETFETYSRRGVLRGLHYQHGAPQAKLIRVLSGRIFDVAADIRQSSPTFGQWAGTVLESRNPRGIFIPPGFAHGFLVLSRTALVGYQCGGAFLPEADTGIRWDDPDIAVKWPIEAVGEII